jgi:signal transduction histidine kinase
VGLAALGYRSVENEDRLRRHEATEEARAAVERAVATHAASLEDLRRREQARPYYHYQPRYMPEDMVVANGPALVQSPLAEESDDPRVLGWFQVARVGARVLPGVEVFGARDRKAAGAFLGAYRSFLHRRLAEVSTKADVPGAAVVAVPVIVVAASEETGQLEEELRVSLEAGRNSLYLENFIARVQQRMRQGVAPSVTVRYTPFRYASRPAHAEATPPLLAWRAVWIPGQAAREQRDAPVDRLLLQGYALDPGAAVPLAWREVAPGVLLRRGDATHGPDGVALPADVPRAWISDALEAEMVSEPARFSSAGAEGNLAEGPGRAAGEEAWTRVAADPSLSVVAVPVAATMDAARRTALGRYLLVVTGLLGVVGVGFFVLLRSVRREVDVARRKEDFVAAVTHELKTPLASIRMYADMLKEGWVPDGDTSAAYAGRIVAETKRLGSLVDQVLDLAAHDRGVSSFRPALGDLGAAVREAAALVSPEASAVSVPVAVEVEDGLPAVSFDPVLVRQIVVNLVDNAVKYSARSPEKDVRVLVRAVPEGVAVVVADRGPGVPAADRKRVFEPFFRSGREETRSARGVGLGLALVRRYAEAHKARLSLESAEGVGTTVTVTFPR